MNDTPGPNTTDPARVAAEKIVRIFGSVVNMHVNDILPDIREAVAAKDAEIERLRDEGTKRMKWILDLIDHAKSLGSKYADNWDKEPAPDVE